MKEHEDTSLLEGYKENLKARSSENFPRENVKNVPNSKKKKNDKEFNNKKN